MNRRIVLPTTLYLFIAIFTLGCSVSHELIHPQTPLCLDPVTYGKPKTYKPTAWSIGILRGSSPFELRTENEDIENPVIVPQSVTDRTARFVADPFMIPYRGRWYLFFETLNCGTESGDIGYAESSDLKTWTYRKTVLNEIFHLSYPYVFESDGFHYMLPESRQAQGIRLYRARSFPDSWEFVRELIPGNFADSSIVKFQNRWWIFTVEGGYSLAIFYADELAGPWKKHAQANFFTDDKSRTRPGGRIIEYEGKLVYFVQDNREHYGHKVRAFIVDTLTPTAFETHEARPHAVLSPGGKGWREVGMHTLDAHQLKDGSWVAAVDGSGY